VAQYVFISTHKALGSISSTTKKKLFTFLPPSHVVFQSFFSCIIFLAVLTAATKGKSHGGGKCPLNLGIHLECLCCKQGRGHQGQPVPHTPTPDTLWFLSSCLIGGSRLPTCSSASLWSSTPARV
jgi:hypothetical protein